MVRIKNNKLLLALLLLLPLSSQAQKLQQENTKKPRRVYFMPITFGEFRLMPDTTIESSFNIGMINGVTKQRGLSLGVVSNINHNLRGRRQRFAAFFGSKCFGRIYARLAGGSLQLCRHSEWLADRTAECCREPSTRSADRTLELYPRHYSQEDRISKYQS